VIFLDAFLCLRSRMPQTLVSRFRNAVRVSPGRLAIRAIAGFVLIAAALPVAVNAQSFATVAGLTFTKTYGGGNPLAQVIAVASTGTNFDFGVSASTNSGGSWLTVTPSSYGCCTPTPGFVTVNVNPGVTLAAGTYTGELVMQSTSGSISMTVTVSLIIEPSTAAYFDQVAGGLTFSMQTDAGQPPAQTLQIRNAGAGSLAWTATVSTSDGGAWLKLSSAGGTAPSILSVNVKVASLPGAGLTAGTHVGQVLLKTSGDTVSVPISVSVGDSVMPQANPLSFSKVYGGGNPLPQIITVGSTGSIFDINAVAISSTGGNWLSVMPNSYGCCTPTPQAITVAVNPAVTLAAGTYMAEVVVKSNSINQGLSIPVTLTVNPSTAAFFSDTPGALNFSMETGGDAPSTQIIQVSNGGAGSLPWTASVTTADGGAWLHLSAAAGTAPSVITVSVVPANLPTNGLTPGVFVGQVVLKNGTSVVTVPVSFTVGDAVFRQVAGLNFTKAYGGADPLPQVVTIASTGTHFDFNAETADSTGGSWLSITPAPNSYGCCTPTPVQVTVSVNPSVTLAAGTYYAQVVARANDGSQVLTIPVTLTIMPNTAAFFDELPGQLSFSMVTRGNAPPAQPLEIRNAGTGALNWTATSSTTDGGAWLTVTPTSGAAPSLANVSVSPAGLPGSGLVAGTFSGQVTLTSSTSRVTIPVTFVVADSVFRQINALDFTKTYGGPNPLPQAIPVISTGTNFDFSAVAINGTGGNWLSITPSSYGCCTPTPQSITVSVSPTVTLAAGTYTAEIIVKANTGSPSVVVPVTLTISPAATPHFDDVPGGLSFFQATGGTAPAVQSFMVRNTTTGLLPWTASVTTSDGGAWLSISSSSGTAPSTVTVSVSPNALPGQGLTPGMFSGQIVLQTARDRETIPVNYIVGAGIFTPIAAINFSRPFGGSNPDPQVISVASMGTNFDFSGLAASSGGGSWLEINPSSFGCCTATPTSITVTAMPSTSQAAGLYVGEIILTSNSGGQIEVVPVNLTVNSPTPAATPVFAPGGGSYGATKQVTITDSSPDAAIYYTTNGNTPTASSTRYTGPISVTTSETIKAIATAPGFPTSAVASATYTLQAVTPAFTPVAGTYTSIQSVSLTSVTAGAVIYYTVDGSTPTTSSAMYTGAITVGVSETIKAIATFTGFNNSAVASATYTINLPPAATPVFSPGAGAYTNIKTVTITSATTGAAIYYTVDNSTPTTTSTKYTGAITVSKTETVKAIATASGYSLSAVASATYTLKGATPTFSPGAGTYTGAQTVTISSATTGAAIYYTVNNSTPTTSSTKYTGPFSVSTSETVEAIATYSGFTNSAVASAAYTINSAVLPTPAFSAGSGTYHTVQLVGISDTVTGASIYYTLDGSTPTATSTAYAGPIAVSKNQTIKAIAMASGYTNSAIASAAYVIIGSPTALAYPATAIATPAATLNAIVNSRGLAGSYYFKYGTSSTALNTSTTTTTLPASASDVNASAALSGLNAATTYYFEVVVTTAGGTATGAVISFTTN
jgi:hypothetical protein